MPSINPKMLLWARQTTGLSLEHAAKSLGITEARGISAIDRLSAIEAGDEQITRPLLLRMTKVYRRSLLAFYLNEVPSRGDRGQDFRSVREPEQGRENLLDALLRDVKARQNMVRSILEDDDTEALPFIGSMRISDGVQAVAKSISNTIKLELGEFRSQNNLEKAFSFLREKVELSGIFVLLVSNLGSHHSVLDVEVFRGFALADDMAPFIALNDQDAKPAWSFTLLHELAHLWLGATGVSDGNLESQIEKFCNNVASQILLPPDELSKAGIGPATSLIEAKSIIQDFANARHLSSSMVAYGLRNQGFISEATWRSLASIFRNGWVQARDLKKQRDKQINGGPDYYVVRRHKLGAGLLQFVSRSIDGGYLSHTKAARVLGVKARSVQRLLSGTLSMGNLV
jgi:Zn-dependent peptidase ImmA (M78 family)